MSTAVLAPQIEIVKPGDREYRTVLVYGPTGAGKSWFSASAEAKLAGRTLVLMTEDADAGLEGFDVDVTHVRSADQMWAVLRALKTGAAPFDKYKGGVLVVDSLTQAQAFFIAEDAEVEHKKGNTKTSLMVPRDSYMRVGENIRRMIWYARTLPMHQIYVCLDRLFTDQDGVIQMKGPDLTPALSGDVRAYCDVVAYMTADKLDVKDKEGKTERRLVRRLFLQPGDGFHARVRAGKGAQIPEFVVSPTIERLLKTLAAKGEEK